MKYQDISRSNGAEWEQFLAYMNEKKYTQAFALLENADVADKALMANVFNYMTGQDGDYTKPNLKTLQEHKDSGFKDDRMQVSETPPSNMKVGQAYFQFDREINE